MAGPSIVSHPVQNIWISKERVTPFTEEQAELLHTVLYPFGTTGSDILISFLTAFLGKKYVGGRSAKKFKYVGGLQKKYVGGDPREKICGGSGGSIKNKNMSGGSVKFSIRPPQDLKWNSPKDKHMLLSVIN